MTPQDIIRRLAKQEAARSNFDATCEEIERYIMPLSNGSFFGANEDTSKKWTTREVWDSTAPIGAERLASMVFSAMFSSTFKWFKIGFRDTRLAGDRDAQDWMEHVTDQMFDAISASNFGLEMAAGLYSMVGFGNTCLTVEPLNPDRWEGLDFSAVPLREVFFEEDWKGRPRVFWRKYRWTAGQIISKFTDPETGKPHPSIPESVLKGAEGGEEKRHDVIFCVYPRPGVAPMTRSEKMRAPSARPFEYEYLLREGVVALGEEGGYYEMPVFHGRWGRAVGSVWGYGPSHFALPTVKLANAWLEAMTDAIEKGVDPATMVTERGLLSDLNLRRGGLTTVRSKDDIWPYESRASVQPAEMLLQDMRNMIRKHYREDDLTLKDSPAMTATEAQLRVEMLNRLFGPTTQSIHNDLGDPILQTVFNMMYRAGQFKDPPQVVLDLNPTMQIEYLGPFMRSQRTDEVASIERLAAAAAAMKKMDFQDASDAFDAEGALREMALRLSTPAACMKSPKDAAAGRAQREKLQQAAAVAQIGKTAAEGDRAAAGAQQLAQGQ